MAKIARLEAAWKTGTGLQMEAMKNEQAKVKEEQEEMKGELERLKREQNATAEELEGVARQSRKLCLSMHGPGMY